MSRRLALSAYLRKNGFKTYIVSGGWGGNDSAFRGKKAYGDTS